MQRTWHYMNGPKDGTEMLNGLIKYPTVCDMFDMGYRYGFNGMERDRDLANDNYDFGARIYDGRLSRWLSVDPLTWKEAGITPYLFAFNSPISFFDPDGKYEIDASLTKSQKKEVKSQAKAERKAQKEKGGKVEKLKDILNRLTVNQENINREKIKTAVEGAKKLLDEYPTAKETFEKMTGSKESADDNSIEKIRYTNFFEENGKGPNIGMKDMPTIGETTMEGLVSLNPKKVNLARVILHEYVHYADKMNYTLGDGTKKGYLGLVINNNVITEEYQLNAIVQTHNFITKTNPNKSEEFIETYKQWLIKNENGELKGIKVEGGYLFELLAFGNIFYEE